jgi:hypothetical protein
VTVFAPRRAMSAPFAMCFFRSRRIAPRTIWRNRVWSRSIF